MVIAGFVDFAFSTFINEITMAEKCRLHREALEGEMPERKMETKRQQVNGYVRGKATWGGRWTLQPQLPAHSLWREEQPTHDLSKLLIHKFIRKIRCFL